MTEGAGNIARPDSTIPCTSFPLSPQNQANACPLSQPLTPLTPPPSASSPQRLSCRSSSLPLHNPTQHLHSKLVAASSHPGAPQPLPPAPPPSASLPQLQLFTPTLAKPTPTPALQLGCNLRDVPSHLDAARLPPFLPPNPERPAQAPLHPVTPFHPISALQLSESNS